MRSALFLLGIALLPVPCTADRLASAKDPFEMAIADACQPDPAEVSSNLVALRRDTSGLRWNDAGEVLMVTWQRRQGCRAMMSTDRTSSEPDPRQLLWVTAVPQVRDFCRALIASSPGSERTPITGADLDLALQQYLGLTPRQGTDRVFVELWVKPESLFRPCNDPETDDTVCDLVPPDTSHTVGNIPNYAAFLSKLRQYSCNGEGHQPWTGLGYTYRWGGDGQVPANEMGASEFALIPGAPYRIEAIYSTSDYCAELRERPSGIDLSCSTE